MARKQLELMSEKQKPKCRYCAVGLSPEGTVCVSCKTYVMAHNAFIWTTPVDLHHMMSARFPEEFEQPEGGLKGHKYTVLIDEAEGFMD